MTEPGGKAVPSCPGVPAGVPASRGSRINGAVATYRPKLLLLLVRPLRLLRLLLLELALAWSEPLISSSCGRS